MRDFGSQLEQVQLLIDKTQHHLIHNASFNPYDYEKLLALSTHINYAYGKALAHAYLAQYAQATMDTDAYRAHLEDAGEIARSKNYFDVLIMCAQLEGKHNSELCDEMAALSSYLEGLKLAAEIKDRRACFTLYREIAELFSDCGAYEDAEVFHQKALQVLSEHTIANGDFYRKHVLIRLLRICCIRKDVQKAEQYWHACSAIPCALGNLPLLLSAEQIRLLLLQGDAEAAAREAEVLLTALHNDKSDAIMLQQVYLYTLELLIDMGLQQQAAWCLQQIDTHYPVLDRKNRIRLQKLRVRYAETFHLIDDSVYRDFYEAAQQGEASNRVATAEVFRSLIALYETAKEQNRMMEERTDLQTAIDRDELTQIYNHRYYVKLITKYLQDDRIRSLGCMMIDVDCFKEYNDHYGHPKGDRTLKEVAQLLSTCLPEDAYAARYGGDEFSCLFVNKTVDELIAFVTQVQQALLAKNIRHVKNCNRSLLTLSFGIYLETNLRDCDEHQIIRRADQALYQAKEKGRNTYAVYAEGRDSQ